MYQNLKAQMAAHNVTIEQMSRLLNIHRNTVANKLDGGSFTLYYREEFSHCKLHF